MLFNGTQKQITLIARGNTLIHSGIHDLHFRSSKIRLYEIILILNIFEMHVWNAGHINFDSLSFNVLRNTKNIV